MKVLRLGRAAAVMAVGALALSACGGGSNIAGTGKPGKLVEYAQTSTIFNNPSVKATEDYVSGRFG